MCTRCKKRIAVVFISKMEKGESVNEGLCLKCAKEIGLPQVGEMMRRMGITDEDLDMINDEMMSAFGGAESMEGLIPKEDDAGDEDGEDGKTATFPFLPRRPPPPPETAPDGPTRPRSASPTSPSGSIWTATASTSPSGPRPGSWTTWWAGSRRSSA